jgi:hypothetical protein
MLNLSLREIKGNMSNLLIKIFTVAVNVYKRRSRCDRYHMVVGFTTICAISLKPRSWRGILDTTSCDKVCQ